MIPGNPNVLNREKEILNTIIVTLIISSTVIIVPDEYYSVFKIISATGLTCSFIYLMTLKNYRGYLFVVAILIYALANIIELVDNDLRSEEAHNYYTIGHLIMFASVVRYWIYNKTNIEL